MSRFPEGFPTFREVVTRVFHSQTFALSQRGFKQRDITIVTTLHWRELVQMCCMLRTTLRTTTDPFSLPTLTRSRTVMSKSLYVRLLLYRYINHSKHFRQVNVLSPSVLTFTPVRSSGHYGDLRDRPGDVVSWTEKDFDVPLFPGYGREHVLDQSSTMTTGRRSLQRRCPVQLGSWHSARCGHRCG